MSMSNIDITIMNKFKMSCRALFLAALLMPLTFTGCGNRSGNSPTSSNLGGIYVSTAADRIDPSLPTWTPVLKDSTNLTTPKSAGLFSICVPNQMTPTQPQSMKDGGTEYLWYAKSVSSSFAIPLTMIVYTVATPPTAINKVEGIMEQEAYSWERTCEMVLQDYHRSPMEFGSVNGLITRRCDYKGINNRSTSGSHKIHGIIYIYRSERGRGYAFTSDYEPSNRFTLPELEASLLSVRDAQ